MVFIQPAYKAPDIEFQQRKYWGLGSRHIRSISGRNVLNSQRTTILCGVPTIPCTAVPNGHINIKIGIECIDARRSGAERSEGLQPDPILRDSSRLAKSAAVSP